MRTTVRSADKGAAAAAAAAGLVATAVAEAAARGAGAREREREPAGGEKRRRMLGEGNWGEGMAVESSRAASIADISARSRALGSCRGKAPVTRWKRENAPIGGGPMRASRDGNA